MASTEDLYWCSTEELFRDVDLDLLYMRQHKQVAGDKMGRYPYMILVHTGKITIGINLDCRMGGAEWADIPEPGLGSDEPIQGLGLREEKIE